MTFPDNKIRKRISILLVVALNITGLFSCQNTVYADSVVLSEEVYYHLDMGVQLAYNLGCDWGSDNIYESPTPILVNTTITFNKDVEVLDTYPLNSPKGSNFNFNGGTSSHNIPDELGDAFWAYKEFYSNYVSTSMTEGNCNSSGKSVSFNYTTILKTSEPFEVVSYGEDEKDYAIYQLFGGKTALEKDQPEIAEAIEIALQAGANGTAGSNKLYLIFCPNVIEYKKYITIGDLEANLALPSSAKQGESYTAKDNSYIDISLTVENAVLEKHYGDGAWETVTTWNGTGVPGENTGESISESCHEIGTVTYRLTVRTTNDQVDTDIKTISITDSREISVVANLVLPSYTYEGHTVLAQDRSTFVVDGVNYSATRAYAENIAKNSFKANSTYGTISRLTDAKANVTFSKRGTYNVTLTVDPISGSNVTDAKPIEVRKTPYIVDSLSGFQKQNRKQILNIAVATYPGKPITDYSIAIKDKKTGNPITLTESNLQENNGTIKTRAVQKTESDDGYFTYLTLEFLTKTPAYNSADPDNTQDFYYEINVTDSKGDTDTASKTFTVTPDIPPAAAISIDTAFLRNEKTNVASITAEDMTVAADGDDVQRKWYYGATTSPAVFTDVSTMDGYKKLSFGTDKKVGFHKVGVGKFTAKLDVKEVWTEPTLEEYVTDVDHLTGMTTATSDVQNVAPVVSLELLNSTEQEILLLANSNAEYQTLMNNKTALQQALLANQIDGQIIIKKLVGNTPSTVTGVSQQRALNFPQPSVIQGNGPLATEVNESGLLAADSENTYFLTYTWINGNPTVPKTIHAIDTYNGEVWSYTTNRNENFTFGQDDTGKYLYLIYDGSNQTILLDKRTGAAAGTINIALSSKVWLSDTLAFILDGTNLYSIDLNSLTKTLVTDNASAVSRVGGNLQCITKGTSSIIRCTLDMETLSVEKNIIIGTTSTGDYKAVCIDSAGKAVLFKETGTGTDTFRGVRAYDNNNVLMKEVSVPSGSGDLNELYFSLDEKGECNHVVAYEEKTSGTNGHYFRTVNLKTGTLTNYSKSTDAYNGIEYAGAFESNGVSYFMFNGWYLYPGGVDYRGSAYLLQFTGTALTMGGMQGFSCLDNFEENIQISDRSLTALHGDNKPATGYFRLKLLAFPRTLAQEAAEIISRFTNKLTFVGDVNSTADQIKAAAEAPKPTVKVIATKDGYLSLSNLSLTPNKKYNYEYDIRPLTEGTESKFTGMSATTGTTTSSQSFINDTRYVTNSYEEDFNNGTVNKFFTVEDAGWFRDGGYGNYYEGSDDKNSSTKLSFIVPAGKQAIVTMDLNMLFVNRGYDALSNNQYKTASEYDNTNVFVDGNTIRDFDTINNNSGGNYIYNSVGAIYYKILEAGTHTIECRSGANNWSYVLINNLRVDILSTSPKTLSSTFNSNEGDQEDWLSMNGSFETPSKVISYGAQASTTYYGPLPSVVTDTSEDDGDIFPSEITYYQTVPAGSIQKGRVHFTGSVGAGDEVYFKPEGCGTFEFSEKSSYSETLSIDAWRSFGPKTEGVHKHIVETQDEQRSVGRMDIFDIVQYPNNSVTITENMAFNSSNTKYFFPKVSSTGKTNLSMFIPKGEYFIKNLRIYYIENGQKVYLQNKALDDMSELSGWVLSSGLTATKVMTQEQENDEEYIKIYKKGEKVLYNIFYDDYEEDPSKTQYWVYQHINWPPDGVHPDAGKILNAPIDRFYLSGKYTVTHWEVDNTQRTGTMGDSSGYNKESNKVTLTFYVDGEGKAPWITYIKTNPVIVKENNSYTIKVGVDDTEKDSLTLETEVYLNGKSIKTDTKTGINANSDGEYPEQIISGLSNAQVGVYQVICTVSDDSGTGIKSYKFTVVSEGKIKGFVNHTDQWDENRKRYNLKRFSEEGNRPMQLSDYLAMSTPRKRGTNVFWSGEKFLLCSETEGKPWKVDAQILSVSEQGNQKNTGYTTNLSNTGRKTASGAELWEGSIWDKGMINKWGRKNPEQLLFVFTAYYAGNKTKTNEVMIIVGSRQDYWQLHRLW